MCNLRFCFAVVRFYIRCAQSFIIKLFVLNIKKINSRYVFRVCELAFSHHCPSLCSMHIAHCMRRGKMHNSFVYSYVVLNVHAFVFTQIALNVHDNQACTCSLIHYHTMGTPSTSDSNAILFVSLSSFFFFFKQTTWDSFSWSRLTEWARETSENRNQCLNLQFLIRSRLKSAWR